MKRVKIFKEIERYIVIFFGSCLFSLGFALFLSPNNINCGGVSGLAMITLHLTHFSSIGVLTALFNVPLFLLGLKVVGKRFFCGSLVGMLGASLAIDWFTQILPQIKIDLFLSALFGGVVTGIGLGIVFYMEASTGGTDILARVLKRVMRNFPIGKLVMMVDITVIVLTGVVFQDIENAMYSGITLFVSTILIDQVVYGLDYSKVAWIISDQYELIAEKIDATLNRGITLINAKGFYMRKEKSILLCAIKRRQLAELKELIHSIDPDAFVILQDAHQVLGDGFKRYDINDL